MQQSLVFFLRDKYDDEVYESSTIFIGNLAVSFTIHYTYELTCSEWICGESIKCESYEDAYNKAVQIINELRDEHQNKTT